MRKLIILTLSLCSLFSVNAAARDDGLRLSIDDAMASNNFKSKLDGKVKLFFADQHYPVPTAQRGEFTTSKKTNAFNKSDQEACEWALLSALLTLQQRAVTEGGNAVVDIVSNYKHVEFSSATEYECHAGNLMAGVALKGRVVTLP